MNGRTTQRWREILNELIANNHNPLTDRERRRVADAVESVDHAGALRQLALDMAASCGSRSIPGSTSPFLQPDLSDAFSKAALRSAHPPGEVGRTDIFPIPRNQGSTESMHQKNQTAARVAGSQSEQATPPPPPRPVHSPLRPR